MDHLKVICDHGGQDTDTGTLLTASLETFAIQAGFQENPFMIHPTILPWTEHCWWKVTLTAIHKYKITLGGTVSTLKKWALNDTFIMKDFLSFHEHNESKAFLQSLNRVQLYLKVATKSDLMLACGQKANPKIHSLDITDIIGLSATAYNWPAQGRPLTTDLSNWNIALDEVYGITPVQPIFRLKDRIPSKNFNSKQYCKWLISDDNQQLYRRRREQQWELWRPIGFGRTWTGRSTFQFSTVTTTDNINGVLHASIQRSTTFKVSILQSTGTFEERNNVIRPNIQTIRGIPFPTNHWALQNIKVPTDQGFFFCELIKNHKATTCGDRSMKHQ